MDQTISYTPSLSCDNPTTIEEEWQPLPPTFKTLPSQPSSQPTRTEINIFSMDICARFCLVNWCDSSLGVHSVSYENHSVILIAVTQRKVPLVCPAKNRTGDLTCGRQTCLLLVNNSPIRLGYATPKTKQSHTPKSHPRTNWRRLNLYFLNNISLALYPQLTPQSLCQQLSNGRGRQGSTI